MVETVAFAMAVALTMISLFSELGAISIFSRAELKMLRCLKIKDMFASKPPMQVFNSLTSELDPCIDKLETWLRRDGISLALHAFVHSPNVDGLDFFFDAPSLLPFHCPILSSKDFFVG